MNFLSGSARAKVRWVPAALYAILLSALAARLYVRPLYDIDLLGYMGNALLEEERDPVRVHQRVYQAVHDELPTIVQQHFRGEEAGVPESQNASRRDRALNAFHFAEFLPCFAIRPAYNQLLWLLSKTGMSLIRASVLVSALSYFGIGVVLFFWLERHVGGWSAALFAGLLMIAPPVMLIGRFTGSDGISTMLALLALYLIFETRGFAAGIALLLFSIFIRTDNVALAAPVIAALVWHRRLPLWMGSVLMAVAAGSVVAINHFAGDYGIRMLYYRNFVGTPIAPAEMSIAFSASDYAAAFRRGLSDALNGYLIPFLLLGAIGMVRGRRFRVLGGVVLLYALLHFLLLPNWQERWFGVLYLVMGVIAVCGRKGTQEIPTASNGSEANLFHAVSAG